MSPREITADERLYDAEEALKRHAASISNLVQGQGESKEILGDHNRRLTAQNEAIVLLRNDLSAIQQMLRDRQLEAVRHEEREKARDEAVDLRLKGIEDSIKSFYSLGKWVLAAFGAVLVGALATFIINGGLHVPTH